LDANLRNKGTINNTNGLLGKESAFGAGKKLKKEVRQDDGVSHQPGDGGQGRFTLGYPTPNQRAGFLLSKIKQLFMRAGRFLRSLWPDEK